MKKLFLGLGTSLVSILPIVAISSCTIDSINFKQQELIEQANLLSDKQTMIATETASQALLNITNIETLNKYYQHVEMESGISYTFASGKINSVSNTTLDITLNVEGPTGTTPITKMIQLTGFRELTIQEKLEEQANLLINKQTLFPNGLETAQEARKIIIDQTTLDMYYSPVLLSSGISYSFISASINTNEPTTINVLLKVQGQAETTPIEKEIELTGFISAQEKLLKQAQLLQNQPVLEGKKDETPREARKTMTEDNFNEYYEPVDLGSSISYNFITSSIDKIEDTTLNVTLLVIGENGTSPITWTIKLTNFKSPDSQLQEQADLLIDMPVLEGKQEQTPLEAKKEITNKETLNLYYSPITLLPGYSYIFKSSLPHPTTATSLNVILTVTGELGATLDKTIEITKFTDPQVKLQVQADRLANNTVLEEEEGQTPREAKAIMSAENFNQYYQPIKLLHGYSYAFTSSAIHPDVKTTLNVTLTVTGEPGTTIVKTIEITGFTDPQDKLQAQADLLIDKPVLDEKKDQTPREAYEAITLENFNEYYALVALSPGYDYTSGILELEPHPTIKTSLNVTFTVTGEEGIDPIYKQIQITGFTNPQDKLEEQAKRLVTKPVLEGKQGETPLEAKKEITNKETLDLYYSPITLLPGYSYTFTSSIVHPDVKTTLNVILTVTGEDGITPIPKTIEITGFTNPQDKLEEQAKRLVTKPVLVGKQGETPTEAQKAMTADNFNQYYTPITLLYGYLYTFTSSAIHPDVKTSLNVILTVTGEDGITPIPKTIEITGFTNPQDKLEEQAKRLVTKSVLVGKQGETPTEAKNKITNKETLDLYYEPIALLHNYSYVFTNSAIHPDVKTSLNVTLTLTGEPGTTLDKTIEITGFTDPKVKLQAQADLLIDKPVLDGKKGQTPSEAYEAITAENFNEYYALVALSPGYDYTSGILELEPHPTIKTSLNVTFTVTGEEGIDPIYKQIQITGFTDPQVKLEEQANLFMDKSVLAAKQGQTPLEAEATMNGTNFHEYYTLPTLSHGYSYTFTSSTVHPTTATSLNVILTITGEDGITPIPKTIEITGFTNPQDKLEEQAKRLVTKSVLVGKQGETPTEAKNKITNKETLDLYYEPIALSHNYSYVFTSSAIHPDVKTTLNVTLTVTGEPGITIIKTIEITGFTDPQVKLQQQAELLIDKPVLDEKKGETPWQAIEVISDSNHEEYYERVEMSPGIFYKFVEAVKKDEISITITFSVTGEEGTTPVTKDVVVTNFRTPTLLEVEFEKIHISLDAKTPSMKISEAITEINRALNFEKRIEAIKTVVDGFPELATEGFIYDIISGEVDPSNSQTLMLKFSIKTTSGTIEELKPILKITNLADSTELELEASWFSASRRGKNSETAVPSEVLAAINSAEGSEAKIASINTHSSTPLPIPSDGFTVVIGEAVVNETTPSTIDIKITISKGDDNQEVTYSITNLLGTEPEPEITVN